MNYSLPIDLSILENIDENDIIDMSSLKFPTKADQRRSALLFIRNTSLKAKLDFSKCSFDDKSTFLMLYMQGDIGIDIPILTTTWIEVLMRKHSSIIKLSSILNSDEIDIFIKNNMEFINVLHNIIISIPLCSIDFYLSCNNKGFTMDEFEKDDYDKLNMANFIRLVDYEDFIHLINPTDGMVPKFYTKYFIKENNPYLSKLISSMPFLDIMNIMVGSEEDVQAEFFKDLENRIETEVNK